jgi:hypothetical protein
MGSLAEGGEIRHKALPMKKRGQQEISMRQVDRGEAITLPADPGHPRFQDSEKSLDPPAAGGKDEDGEARRTGPDNAWLNQRGGRFGVRRSFLPTAEVRATGQIHRMDGVRAASAIRFRRRPTGISLTPSPALADDRDRGSAMVPPETTRTAASATLFALPSAAVRFSRRTRPGPRQQGQHLGKGFPRQQPGRPAPPWRTTRHFDTCRTTHILSDLPAAPPWRGHHGARTCDFPVVSGGFPNRPRHGELTPHRLPPPTGPPTSRSPRPLSVVVQAVEDCKAETLLLLHGGRGCADHDQGHAERKVNHEGDQNRDPAVGPGRLRG